MEQLALFSGAEARRTGRRRRNLGQSATTSTQWDLWTEKADAEKEMVLFFLDIRDFTPFVARHQAQEVIYLIRKLFSTLQNIIRIHHGRIIETTGDGFYAAFGFDRDVRVAVNEAVDSGMAILKILQRLNDTSFEIKLNRRIEVGIGVHAGKVATGSLQLGSKQHVVVMGYPVNVASRLQAATKELNNNFIISSAVYDILNDRTDKNVSAKVNNVSVTAHLRGMSEPCKLHLIGNAYAA